MWNCFRWRTWSELRSIMNVFCRSFNWICSRTFLPLFLSVTRITVLCSAAAPALILARWMSIGDVGGDVACKIEVLTLNWPRLRNNEKPPMYGVMLELFMVFSTVGLPSRYRRWKWVCWKLAKVRSPLSAYRTWRIKVNHSRQLGPPFMVMHPLQLLLRPSPLKKNGETSI